MDATEEPAANISAVTLVEGAEDTNAEADVPKKTVVFIDPPEDEVKEGGEVLQSEVEEDKTQKTEPQKKELDPRSYQSVLYIEETVPPGERHLANNLFRAFSPYRFFWKIPCFRIPMITKKLEDGSYLFEFNLKSVIGIGFIATAALFVILMVGVSYGIVSILLNFPTRPKESILKLKSGKTLTPNQLRAEELFIFQRNFAPLIIVLCSLVHIIVADTNFYFRRNAATGYFTFWTNAVELLKIDVADGVRKFMVKCHLFYGFFLFLFLSFACTSWAPITSGTSALFGMLLIRGFDAPNIHRSEYFYILRWFCALLVAYIIWVSKAYVYLLLYKSRILTNAYKGWNNRLERVLHKGEGGKYREEKNKNRTGYDHLFKDHVVLLDLVDGADTLFANTMESYYSTQVVSICFEIYYLYRSLSEHTEFTGARRLDAVVIGLYLLHTLVVFFLVTTSAVEVGEEAMNGLDVVRRKGLLGKKTEEEVFFMLSIYMSYSGQCETAISGGNYYVIDKAFFVGIIGTIFSYFIIIIQFTPPLAMNDPTKLALINKTELLQQVEFHHELIKSLPSYN